MQKWIKVVPASECVEGKAYFIGRIWNEGDEFHQHMDFLGCGLNGRQVWTEKPGIAVRAVFNEKMRQTLASNAKLRMVEIPVDVDTRWKARKRRF